MIARPGGLEVGQVGGVVHVAERIGIDVADLDGMAVAELALDGPGARAGGHVPDPSRRRRRAACRCRTVGPDGHDHDRRPRADRRRWRTHFGDLDRARADRATRGAPVRIADWRWCSAMWSCVTRGSSMSVAASARTCGASASTATMSTASRSSPSGSRKRAASCRTSGSRKARPCPIPPTTSTSSSRTRSSSTSRMTARPRERWCG